MAEVRPFPMGEKEFVALMAMMMALQALAIDSMLPALGVMSRDLGVADSNQRQLVVGLFLLSSGLGSLFPGALADRFGRRAVALTCVGGYVVFSVAAALMQDFTALLVMRCCAGLVSSGMIVMSTAIVRDRFSGDKMARIQSLVSMVFMIVPMLAPSLGQFVLLFAGWRWIFGVMAALGALVWSWAWLRLPETLHPEFRQSIRVGAILGNMRVVIFTRAAAGYILGIALIQGALFGFINSAQQLIGEHFGAGRAFPLVFGGMALSMACTNLVNSRIVERFGARRVSHAALLAYLGIAAVQLWLASLPHETLWQFVPAMALNLCLMGFIGSNFASIALQPFARIAGVAASLQVFIRMVVGALLGMLIGQAYDGTAVPLAGSLLVFGMLGLSLVLYSERWRLFRRLHGQVEQV